MNQRKTQSAVSSTSHNRAKLWGMILTLAAVVTLAYFYSSAVEAAPSNQTIPQRTPTAPATAIPTVTNTPDAPPPATNTPQPPPTNTPGTSNPQPTATSQPGGPAATNTPTTAAQPTNTPAAPTTPTAIPDFALQAEMVLVSGVPMQGQEVVLRVIVKNPGRVEARNVTVRDELPSQLELVAMDAAGGATATEKASNGRTIVLFTWAALRAGGEAQATLTVRIGASVANGTVIDNLAVAFADNAAAVTTGISLGTPPVHLPTFD